MSRLTDLIRQAKAKDPQLGADLDAEVRELTRRRTFGLVFERHQPEAVELPGVVPSIGSKVRVLPPRGASSKGDQRLWRVVARDKQAGMLHLVEYDTPHHVEPESQTAAEDNTVVVSEFQDRVYPGLVETGRVERGGDAPVHTVINGENFHALQMLTYTHRGKVDAIYIDPPYNTGAKDWKYNNHYVEGDDAYRHSKWLAMMERRLQLAKELLNPKNSVLIVTIDENEVHRTGLLLGQVFPEAPSQMISAVINPKGASLGRDFARVDEYIFVLYFGEAGVKAEVRDMLDERKNASASTSVKWSSLIRGGAQGVRTDSPGAYYPVFVDPTANTIHSFGEALPMGVDRETISAPPGTITVWPPTHPSGAEGRWGIGPESARTLYASGALRLGKVDPSKGRFPLSYLSAGIMKKVASGEIITEGRRADGTLIVRYPADTKVTQPKTVWKMPAHNAGEYGSKLVASMIPGRRFPFPKALYAVEDTLRFFVRDKPNAVVLDFFAGSGTTAHAVMRLNKQDDGRRQCISITNNEVGAEEQKKLRSEGLRPGDPSWEQRGICDYITKPRIEAAITGMTPEGQPILGDYKFTDEFPIADGLEQNAAFFTLTYERPMMIARNRAFERVAPLLWMRAGSTGPVLTDVYEKGWDLSDSYGVLAEGDAAPGFVAALEGRPSVRTAFIITDEDTVFRAIARDLPEHLETVRLYESYMHTFEIPGGAG